MLPGADDLLRLKQCHIEQKPKRFKAMPTRDLRQMTNPFCNKSGCFQRIAFPLGRQRAVRPANLTLSHLLMSSVAWRGIALRLHISIYPLSAAQPQV
ncbi:MAG: hypothetical protein A4S14_07715 [Proteobacteria bacterium SG_bin9]|nr:MAG: hypothetical protein A4S14_07715 [Proteobacteria bacterium SG_bin9]